MRRFALIACFLTLGLSAPAVAATAPPPVLPEPTLKSVSKEALVEMDDGVKIAITVALPSADGKTPLPGRFPVVFGMTPYGRTTLCSCYPPSFWATRGMVGAVADVRGTGGSGGNLEGNYFSPREARDGYNLVEYFARQPYSTGKVGMAGGSYVGITQLRTAGEQPPHLAAIAPQVPIADLYREGFTHGGIPNFLFDLQYIGVQGLPGVSGINTDPALLGDTIAHKAGQSLVGEIAYDYLERPNDGPFYRKRSPITKAGKIEAPVLIIGGWRDGLSARGGPELYRKLARRRGVETRLYMDPCTHKGCGLPLAPLTDAPGVYNVSALVYEFMAKHLAGATTPRRPRVEYYMQEQDRYLAAHSWPPPGTEFRRYGLDHGKLRAAGSAEDGATAQYVTNPTAGLSMALDRFGTVAATPYVPTDQRLEGPQGLTFRTKPLPRAAELAGPIALKLVAASTAPDTDWHAKLADVAPDGSESIITDGALRASHRRLDPRRSTPERPYHPHTNPQPIEPNRFYRYDIEIWPTAYELAPGHRLQLRLTSTDLPTHFPGSLEFDRDDPLSLELKVNMPATNTVRLDRSFLLVPFSR